MKKIFMGTSFFLISMFGFSQTNFKLEYDNSGNLVKRSLVVLPDVGARFLTTPKSEEDILKEELKVYPNPASTYVNVEGVLPVDCDEAKIQLINNQGQVLQDFMYYGRFTQVDVSTLDAGIYYLVVYYSKKNKTAYKLIVSK